jgi:tetratricopeptide (TPR) repeat protein
MKKILFPLLFIFLIQSTSYSQTNEDKKKAVDLAKKGIKLEDKEGKYDEAIALFKQAQQLDPANINYPYEIAFTYYLKKDYATAIGLTSELLNHKDVTDEVYRLLGNAYDLSGDPDKALETYNKGLSIFPNSGKLYHEIGILQANRDSAEAAIDNWELGVKADPTFASNYYELTKVFCNSTERVWGVLYGELFLNLERNSDRSYEISKLLYDTYKEAININATVDKTYNLPAQISFTKVFIADTSAASLPFPNLFELTVAKSIGNTKKISLKGLNSIRNSYVTLWYKMKNNEKYPNVLFNWHKYLIDKGYFKAYNYWLFNNGNVNEFEKWGKDNYDEFKEFAEWFTANPMKIDKEHYFVRTQY